jgi:hypothetical protein
MPINTANQNHSRSIILGGVAFVSLFTILSVGAMNYQSQNTKNASASMVNDQIKSLNLKLPSKPSLPSISNEQMNMYQDQYNKTKSQPVSQNVQEQIQKRLDKNPQAQKPSSKSVITVEQAKEKINKLKADNKFTPQQLADFRVAFNKNVDESYSKDKAIELKKYLEQALPISPIPPVATSSMALPPVPVLPPELINQQSVAPTI